MFVTSATDQGQDLVTGNAKVVAGPVIVADVADLMTREAEVDLVIERADLSVVHRNLEALLQKEKAPKVHLEIGRKVDLEANPGISNVDNF